MSQAFERHGVTYQQAELDRSVAYLEIEPLFAHGRVELLDHSVLARELKNLERKPKPGGRVAVDHPRGHHDDYANALAIGAAAVAATAGVSDCHCIFMDECTHIPRCPVCAGAGTLGTGTDEAPSVACYACEGVTAA